MTNPNPEVELTKEFRTFAEHEDHKIDKRLVDDFYPVMPILDEEELESKVIGDSLKTSKIKIWRD